MFSFRKFRQVCVLKKYICTFKLYFVSVTEHNCSLDGVNSLHDLQFLREHSFFRRGGGGVGRRNSEEDN